MTIEIFTRDLIQAVSDWQPGGSHDQKVIQLPKALTTEIESERRKIKAKSSAAS